MLLGPFATRSSMCGRARLALVGTALLGLLAGRADGSCATALAALQTSVALGGACADNGAGNSASTCAAACTTVLDGYVAGCNGAPLQDASSYTLMELARTSMSATANACRQSFSTHAYTFSIQPGSTDRTRPRGSQGAGSGTMRARRHNRARRDLTHVPHPRRAACSNLMMYLGQAVRIFGACPRQATLPCTDVCQGLLNNLTAVCSAAQSVSAPAAVMAAVGLQCPTQTPTCVLGTAAFVTAGAMLQMGLPSTCHSPFGSPAPSAAPRWGAPLAAALAAAAAALL